MRVTLLCADRGVPFGGTRKGASVHLQSLAAALLRQGHAVTVLAASPGDADALGAWQARGVTTHVLADGADAIARQLRDAGSEQVIERLALASPQGAIAARSAGVPHVYEVNAPLDEEAARHRGLADAEGARACLAPGFAATTGAVAVSDEVADWVHRVSPVPIAVSVQPNGAGPAFFAPPDAAAVRRAESRLPQEPGAFRVGFVGAFRPWHDLPTLITAVAHVARERRTRLVVVGDGPARDEIAALAARAGAPLTLVGAVPHEDVPAHLALMDVVAVPYASADVYFSPLKLFEAMAAGCAIVASATRPVARVVTHGREAWLVPPGDAAALGGALLELARDAELRRRLGAEARRTAEAHHTWDAVARRVLEFAAARGRREDAPCNR